MEPTRLFPIIALFSLAAVEYGGWALLGFLTGRGTLGAFRERFFRAGRAHAGVPLVPSLAYFIYLGRTGYPPPTCSGWPERCCWPACSPKSGGFFLHRGSGQEGRGSVGTTLTGAGALLIAAALIILAAGPITHR
jgi:hypothetical protein